MIAAEPTRQADRDRTQAAAPAAAPNASTPP
jgi:hypothetical protein